MMHYRATTLRSSQARKNSADLSNIQLMSPVDRTWGIFKKLVLTAVLAVFMATLLPSNHVSAAPTLSLDQATCTANGGTWVVDNVPYCSGVTYVGAQSPDWQVKSLLYYRIISACFQNNDAIITSQNGQTGKWFEPGEVTAGAYLRGSVSGGEGGTPNAECSNPAETLNTALTMWGWGTDYNQALCDFGWQRTNGTPCLSSSGGSGDFKPKSGQAGSAASQAFKKAVKNSVYNIYNTTTEPTLDGAGWYTFYLRTFGQSCAIGSTGTTTKPPGFSTSSPQSKAFVIPRFIDGSMQSVYYTNTPHQRDKEFATRIGPNFTPVINSCADMENQLKHFAPDYFKWALKHPNEVLKNETAANRTSSATEETTACKIEGVGWIVCPIAGFLGMITDGLFGVLTTLLSVTPLDSGGATYNTWQAMRNIANAAFVIAFLIIIFSQLSSVGITNYGVKKLLPRIIIAAILVNASYWICAIAVDLSNILGYSMQSLLTGFIATTDTVGSGNNQFGELISWVLSAGAVGAVGGLVIGNVGWVAALSLLLPVLITALFAATVVVLVLAARQALLIIMVVISPLAFVAYLLPNTEDLFQKWRKLFTTLLIMFPIISIVFGGSQLAAAVIRAGTTNPLIYILSLAVQIVPFFLVPLILKVSGGLLSKFGGMINNPNKGPFDRMRKGAEGVQKRVQGRASLQSLRGARGGWKYRREARRDAQTSSIETLKNRASEAYTAGLMGSSENPSEFAKKVAGGGAFGGQPDQADLQRVLAGAKFTIEKAELEDVKAEHAIIDTLDKVGVKAILDNDAAPEGRKAAALERLIKIGDAADYADVVSKYAQDTSPEHSILRKSLASALAENGPQFLKASDIDNISNGRLGGTLEQVAKKNIASGVYSQEKMVSETAGNLSFAFEQSDFAGKQAMVYTAAALKENETLKGRIKHNVDAIKKISVGESPPKPPTSPAGTPSPTA